MFIIGICTLPLMATWKYNGVYEYSFGKFGHRLLLGILHVCIYVYIYINWILMTNCNREWNVLSRVFLGVRKVFHFNAGLCHMSNKSCSFTNRCSRHFFSNIHIWPRVLKVFQWCGTYSWVYCTEHTCVCWQCSVSLATKHWVCEDDDEVSKVYSMWLRGRETAAHLAEFVNGNILVLLLNPKMNLISSLYIFLFV